MFGNYLGIGRDRGKDSGNKYARNQTKATASTRCQKCNQLGHYTYECTGQREYKVRPTRTQILNNPKLRTKVTGQHQAIEAPPATELMPKEGTAAAILAANEAKRAAKAAKLKAQQQQDDRRSRRKSRSASMSSSGSSASSSGSDSRSSYSSSSRSRSRSRTNGRKLSATASLVYCSGQIHSRLKEDGPQELVDGSVADKTRVIIENLEKVLKAGGSSLQQLVKVNIFITSFEIFKEMNDEYIKLIPDPKPARTSIYTSDLSRAQTTARNVAAQNRSNPPPPVIVSPLLREQFFGSAEGSPWNSGLYSSSHLPWEDHRRFKLAEHAESLNDVAARADQVLRHFVMPHVVEAATSSQQHHILLVAHGIWLSEMMFAFKRCEQGPRARFVKTGGYQNTGWSRLEVELADETNSTELNGLDGVGELEDDPARVVPASSDEPGPNGEDNAREATPPNPDRQSIPSADSTGMPQHIADLLPKLPNVPTPRDERLPLPLPNDEPLPRLKVKVIALHQAEHLQGLKRTKGGVGSEAWDPNQKTIRDFFAGGNSKESKQ
ncbi:hypothetical protein OIO90_006311 [Microbotryomycetes sp. JL221]|nr:hypothetical protein OIO90_006311 [Microbotryomycetes sp. JL221]